jgi:serine/threonine-protein kinase
VNDVLEGKWRLERKLGEGGMGTVYLAHDLQLDRKVAIKILASSLAGDSELVTRFEREARMTASLEHPNIVPVYAVGEMEGRPFIVMKKLEGRTLAAYLRECGALSGDELMALMRQLCSGLDFIHARGFIHRDIKSGNIFIGPDGLATILDFGILRSSENAEALTRTGMVMGTPQYMSPEQALGAREIDHRADLYALAVLLFECLTGTLPFEAESELSLVQMHAHAPAPDVTERAPWVPKQVSEVVKRALAKRPEDRYASAGGLLAALEDAYAGKTSALVTGSYDASGALVPDSGSIPMLSSPMLTQPSMKRLSGDAPGFGRKATPPAQVASRRADDSARASSVSASAPTSSTDAGDPAARGASGPSRLARKGKAQAIVGGVVLVALVVVGYLTYARVRSSSAAEKVGTGSHAPPLVLLDAGLDLTSELSAESEADAGAVVASAQIDNEKGADGSSEDASDSAPEEVADHPRNRSAVKHVASRQPVEHGSGTLNLITTLRGEPYWASVNVDGVHKGNTPLLLDLPAGKHRIRFERSGFQPVNRQIKIASGRSRVLRVELTP